MFAEGFKLLTKEKSREKTNEVYGQKFYSGKKEEMTAAFVCL